MPYNEWVQEYGDLTIERKPYHGTVYQGKERRPIGKVERGKFPSDGWTAYNAQGQRVGEKPHKTALAGAWALRG